MPQVIELIAQNVADRAQFAAEAMLVAQQSRVGIPASVDELRKIDGDQWQVRRIAGKRVGIVARLEPDTDVAAGAAGRRARIRQSASGTITGVLAGTSASEASLAQQRPAVLDDRAALNEQRHRRAP